jgi:hypothetical protein
VAVAAVKALWGEEVPPRAPVTLCAQITPDYRREILRIVGKNDLVILFDQESRTNPDGKHKVLLQFDMFRGEKWHADT